jgi:hypothetical protein
MPRNLSLVIALVLAAAGCGEHQDPALKLAAEETANAASQVATTLTEEVDQLRHKRSLAEGTSLQTLRDIGLSRPVAVVHDPAADVYLISNAGRDGAPGFITSVLPDGSVDAVRWIDGVLGSPAGMALVQSRLFVADGDHLHVFDRETGEPRGSVHIEGAVALSDVAEGPRGAIYVTDSGISGERRAPLGAVYRVSRRGTVSVIAKSSVLGRPTGLVTVKGIAWIAAVKPEKFYGVAPDGHLTHGAKLPFAGGYAGLTHADGKVFFSSPQTRTVYAGPLDGPFEPVVIGVEAPGDVGWDAARDRILVPLTDADVLEVHTLAVEPS